MKKFLTTCTALLTVLALFGQSSAGFWSESNRSDFARPAFMPQSWRSLSLNFDAMRNHLRQAPMEFTAAAQNAPLQLVLPMPDGTMETFQVWESPIMEPALAAKYPSIKTFAGRSIQDPNTSLRFDYNSNGFNAIIHTRTGTALIAPNSSDAAEVYLSFWVKDVDFTTEAAQQYHCEVKHTEEEIAAYNGDFAPSAERSAVPVDLFTYRLALATTAEYSNSEGGTMTSVMNAVVNVMNNVNSVFERDAAVRMVLIANTDDVFFFSNPDPYTNGQTDDMISENPAVLNSAFTVSGYDVGHVFGTNGGGLASLAGVCNSEGGLSQFPKARAASCKFGPYSGPLFYIIAGHEMGHQFNATHTFNKCDDDNENPGTAYEPGSGSTIMCYNGNGVCGVNHIQPTSDAFFHINSMLRIQEFTRTAGGNACEQVVAVGNEMPEANIPMEGGFFIPVSTPFSLTGVGSDANDPLSQLTYTWEQYDLGPPSTLGQPITTAPLFVWYTPTDNPTRIFPRIETIISNTSDIREVLPTTTRELTFRFVVRDNHADAGAFNYEEIVFNSTAAAGPFLVNYPNGGESFTVGQHIEVTWDVANTQLAPVNCQKVNIHMSTDGGFTYPIVLATNIANDGTAFVTLPNNPSTSARIRIEAADNIFFDISNQNFAISALTAPGFVFSSNQLEGLSCDEISFTLNTAAVLGYDGQVSFALSNPPAGITATFSPTTVNAGQSTVMTVNTSGATQTGLVTLSVVASSAGQADQVRDFLLNVVETDLSGIAAVTPTDGASSQGALPTITWSNNPNADSYDIEISADPSFAQVLDSEEGLTTNSYTPSVTLADGETYYWRVRASNACGDGEFGDPFSFRTAAQACIVKASSGDQNDINIPGTGLPLITSVINFPQGGTISDVNVRRVKGNQSAIRDIQIRLKAPDNTSVTLLSQPACGGSNFNCGFNDQAPTTLTNCPVANTNYKPFGSLADFNGKNSQGNWTLELEVVDTDGEGGNFDDWELEICAGLQSANPVIIKNDTLGVPPLGTNRIYLDNLIATDADNTADELEFTIVVNTQYGQVKRNGQTLGVGSTFTMRDVFNNVLTYTNTNDAQPYDYFTFTVNDGGGGFVGTPRFYLKLDPNAPIISGTNELESSEIGLYPNPATSEVNLVLSANAGLANAATLLDIQGRRIAVQTTGIGTSTVKLNTGNVPAGLYFVEVKTAMGTFTRKVVIE